jgi:cystathionine gamma-synthase
MSASTARPRSRGKGKIDVRRCAPAAELGAPAADADAVIAAAKMIVPATSFGGVESTWERRARWPGETAPESLIRLSVGVEPLSDIVADIDHALTALR